MMFVKGQPFQYCSPVLKASANTAELLFLKFLTIGNQKRNFSNGKTFGDFAISLSDIQDGDGISKARQLEADNG